MKQKKRSRPKTAKNKKPQHNPKSHFCADHRGAKYGYHEDDGLYPILL